MPFYHASFFFLINNLYFSIPTATAQIFNPIAELAIPLGASKFEWTIDNIRIKKFILAPIFATNYFLDVSVLLDVKHCPKLQSCATSRKYNDVTLRKWQKP